MNTQHKDKLFTIDRTIRTILNGSVVICLLLLIAASLQTSYKQILTYAFMGIGIWCVVLIVCRICLSPFVKSDEQEDFENKLDYVLEQRGVIHQQIHPISSALSPFNNLTEEQQEKVKNILCSLPSHPDKPDSISMAIVSQYLTALHQMGVMTLSDKRALRLWVAQITHKNVPDTSHFNEAVPSTNRKEVAKVRRELEQLLHIKPLS